MIAKYPKRRNITTRKIKQYKITYDMLAKWFGYTDGRSFNGSSAKKDMIYGITKVIEHIENCTSDKRL